jgi:hypothetical protein
MINNVATPKKGLHAALLIKLREICLALPEVVETIKWGHPTFEAGKKILRCSTTIMVGPASHFGHRWKNRRSFVATNDFSLLRTPQSGDGFVSARTGN